MSANVCRDTESARKGRLWLPRRAKASGSEAVAERPIIDMHTLRLPREEAARVEMFKKLNRLPTGDLYVFLMNVTGVNEDGSNRVLVDYARFDAEDDVRPTIDTRQCACRAINPIG